MGKIIKREGQTLSLGRKKQRKEEIQNKGKEIS
jgi:hypothetical protein